MCYRIASGYSVHLFVETSLGHDASLSLGRYRGLLQKPSCPVGASLPLRPAGVDPLLVAAVAMTDVNVRRRGESFL